ncbi:hypothetical protein GWC95_11210 [Sediminibacterium roseum]|uniref:Uncharacterized protein n=1 Tax=Sediminibacterium roseum TaxID=1978412 RepID=A0ABW9ZW89_9BACT|nr:hypothetical protein [Sediminibacterium roseum]NCI50494.1 hypothetical protein [Sediminibacterium roseum]
MRESKLADFNQVLLPSGPVQETTQPIYLPMHQSLQNPIKLTTVFSGELLMS